MYMSPPNGPGKGHVVVSEATAHQRKLLEDALSGLGSVARLYVRLNTRTDTSLEYLRTSHTSHTHYTHITPHTSHTHMYVHNTHITQHMKDSARQMYTSKEKTELDQDYSSNCKLHERVVRVHLHVHVHVDAGVCGTCTGSC